MDDDGDLGLLDFLQQEVSLRGSIENQWEIELPLKTKGGSDILMAPGGHQQGNASFENRRHRIQSQVGIWFLILLCLGSFLEVALGLEEMLPQHGERLGAGSRRFSSSSKAA